ncbi:MAG TPA: SPOR domain-containing protein, partial [bacterium]|nr:SPOR domain-containing protein [bacterium]
PPREEPKEVLPEGTVEPLVPSPMLTPSGPGSATASPPPGTDQASLGTDKASKTTAPTKEVSTIARLNTTSAPAQNLSNPPPSHAQSKPAPNSAPVNAEQAKPAPAKPTTTEPVAVKPTTTEPAAPSSSAKYGVHVCSMQTEAHAQEEAVRFQKAGYPAFVRRVDLGEKGIWHRVYAGPYDDHAAAERAAEEVRARGLTDFTLVQRISGKSSSGS